MPSLSLHVYSGGAVCVDALTAPPNASKFLPLCIDFVDTILEQCEPCGDLLI